MFKQFSKCPFPKILSRDDRVSHLKAFSSYSKQGQLANDASSSVLFIFSIFSSFLACLYMFYRVLVHQQVNSVGRFRYLLCFNESVTDGQTDGPTDRPSYRDARSHLKRAIPGQRSVRAFQNLICILRLVLLPSNPYSYIPEGPRKKCFDFDTFGNSII